MRANRFAAAAALALAAALPAHAGLFDDAEARRQIDELRRDLRKQGDDNTARIAKLEEQISHIGVVELIRSIDELNQELAQLRGQMEVLQNENQQLQKRQRDFYLDIDSRLKRLEGANAAAGAPAAGTSADAAGGATAPAGSAGALSASGAPTSAASTVASASPTAPAASGPAAEFGPVPPVASAKGSSRDDQAREVKAYDTASNLFRRNDFPAAIQSFRAFLHDYPSSALAPNANYWIGISYANMRDWRNALAAQNEVLAKYPQSPKAPDALLAIAAVHAEQGDSRGARNTYEDIIARYPQSDAAGKARTRLAALRAR
jgi:tol-pal system protein YbgF